MHYSVNYFQMVILSKLFTNNKTIKIQLIKIEYYEPKKFPI